MHMCVGDCEKLLRWKYSVIKAVLISKPYTSVRPLSGFTDVSVFFAMPSAFGIAKVRQVWLKDQANKA